MKNRVDFIDWLKAVGMFLIVFGHYFGEPFDQFTQPIYPKQLGVAFFVFVMGWGLASETRPQWQVVYNRLFPMYFWGFGIAIFLSMLFFIFQGRLLFSNYLPFVAGFNVFVDSFPANPTTWFIGTYLHILLFWAVLLRKIPITKPLIFMVFIAEWLIRAFWIGFEHLFTGYMLISNWITILLLGMYMCKQGDNHKVTKALVVLIVWAIFLFVWASLMNLASLKQSFPFKTLPSWGAIQNGLTISTAISITYIANTLIAVKFFSLVPANKIVRFFSRNTIIVFIGHMPLYDVAEPIARIFVETGWGKRTIIVFIMFVGLAVVSEVLHKLLNINKYKIMLWQRLSRRNT